MSYARQSVGIAAQPPSGDGSYGESAFYDKSIPKWRCPASLTEIVQDGHVDPPRSSASPADP
jgi:hypothetical protein